MPGTCTFIPCGRNIQAKGLCNSHYWQQWMGRPLTEIGKEKEPKVVKPKPTRAELFWSKVNKTETCWLWTASTTGRGRRYGSFGVGYPKVMLAHRWSYENTHGPIPAGMQIDHICRVTLCVNPSHLRVVTNKQNHENLVAQVGSQTGVRGVTWSKRQRKFYVQVGHNGRRHCWGPGFDDLAAAEQAAIELRNRLFTHNDTDAVRS